jgi:hypothetical protein
MRIGMRKGACENDYVSFWLEDGILMGMYKKDVVIGLKAAKEIVSLRKEFTKGVAFPALAYIKHVKVVSKEARDYFAVEGTDLLLKLALVTDSGFSKILGNMFLLLDKPMTPTKMFTNKEEATKWLRKGRESESMQEHQEKEVE